MKGSDHKLAELILYISARHETDERFGTARLAETLFHADFSSYARTGRSITNEMYVRGDQGPVPVGLPEVCDQLQREQALAIADRLSEGLPLQHPVALRPADLSAFTANEIATIDHVLRELAGAATPSHVAHWFDAWELAADGEEIPYQTAFLSNRQPSAEDRAFARELGREHVQGAA